MAYELTWHTQGSVLLLSLSGDYNLDAAKEVNRKITEELERSKQGLYLIIDATHMARPHDFQAIRDTQKYMDHQNLKHIYAVATDKLTKLTMMVIFHFSRARFHMTESQDKASTMIRRQIGTS